MSNDMQVKELLPKLSTRGDIAAAALGYSIGFAVDVFIFPVGLPPTTTAAVFAAAGVGFKNGVQAFLEPRRNARKNAEQVASRRASLRRQTELLLADLSLEELESHAVDLEKMSTLWEKGLCSNDDFADFIQARVRSAYPELFNLSRSLSGLDTAAEEPPASES